MTESAADTRLVLSTASSPEEATRLCRALVEERLAACANLIPGMQSIYRWQGAVEEANETLILLKTTTANIGALENRLRELHNYEVPEFLVLDVDSGSHAYLDWLRQQVAL